jgi:hypothetical protein
MSIVCLADFVSNNEVEKLINRGQFYFNAHQIFLRANKQLVWNSQYPIRAMTEFTIDHRIYAAVVKIKQSMFGFRHRCVVTFYEWRNNQLNRAEINHRHEIALPFNGLQESTFYKLECVANRYLAVHIPEDTAYVYDLWDLSRPKIAHPFSRPEISQIVHNQQNDEVCFYSLTRPKNDFLVQLSEWNIKTNQCIHKLTPNTASFYKSLFIFFGGKLIVLQNDKKIIFVDQANMTHTFYSYDILPETRLLANTSTNVLVLSDPQLAVSRVFSFFEG